MTNEYLLPHKKEFSDQFFNFNPRKKKKHNLSKNRDLLNFKQ